MIILQQDNGGKELWYTDTKNEIIIIIIIIIIISRTRLWRHEWDWIFCVVITEEYIVTVNSDELIGATECVVNRCCRFKIEYDKVFERVGYWGSRKTFWSSSKREVSEED